MAGSIGTQTLFTELRSRPPDMITTNYDFIGHGWYASLHQGLAKLYGEK
jgi:hypothetical protein